jgi:polysaccharide export outer membrane protein
VQPVTVPPATVVAPPGISPGTIPAGAGANQGNQGVPVVFRPGDNMIVSFSDLPAQVALTPIAADLGADGMIRLHHNVSVYALGKTPRSLEQEIRSEFVPKYYKYLTVTIKSDLRFFHVNGEVRVPSQYPWRGENTVLRAIGQAGGFTDWAKKSKVKVTRSNGQQFIVNCDKALKDPTKDLPVYPGDYIDIPKKNPFGF